MFAALSSHHSPFPTAELDPSAVNLPHPLPCNFTHRSAEHAIHIKVVVLLVPGLTPTVLSFPPLPTSATKNPNLPIPVHLSSDPPPQTASKPPDLPVSSTSTRKRRRHYMAHHTRMLPYLSHSRPGRCNTYTNRPQQLFPDTCRW
jgi:hypothetical protein